MKATGWSRMTRRAMQSRASTSSAANGAAPASRLSCVSCSDMRSCAITLNLAGCATTHILVPDMFELGARVGLRRIGRQHDVGQLALDLPIQLVDQHILAGKIAEQRALGHAGRLGNRRRRRAPDAARGKFRDGRFEQRTTFVAGFESGHRITKNEQLLSILKRPLKSKKPLDSGFLLGLADRLTADRPGWTRRTSPASTL